MSPGRISTKTNFRRFEDFIGRALEALGYEVRKEVRLPENSSPRKVQFADYVISKDNDKKIVEVKYYTLNSGPYSSLDRAYLQVLTMLELNPEYSGVVITNFVFSKGRIEGLRKRFSDRIVYWSLKDILLQLGDHPDLLEEALHFIPPDKREQWLPNFHKIQSARLRTNDEYALSLIHI